MKQPRASGARLDKTECSLLYKHLRTMSLPNSEYRELMEVMHKLRKGAGEEPT